MGTQIDAHTSKEKTEASCPPRDPAGAHWGRAFKMAFTSSATAVRANSNWSWKGQWEDSHGRPGLSSSPTGPLGSGAGAVTWREWGTPGGGPEAGGKGRLLLASLGKGGIEGWGREEQSP